MEKIIIYFKKKSSLKLFFIVYILFFTFSVSFAQKYNEKLLILGNVEDAKFEDIKLIMNEYWQSDTSAKKSGWKPYKRWEHFWETRLMPDGSYPNLIRLFDKWNNYENKSFEAIQTSNYEWKAVGPFNRANRDERFGKWVSKTSTNLGRNNVVKFHPNNPNEIWAGASTGGVWKSTDGGQTWYNFPFTAFLSLGVSDIAISPSNPDIVYVATGDHIHWGTTYTIGIIKTIDGGINWELTDFAYQLKSGIKICRLLIHPTDPNNLIAATTDGIYKTTDGGLTWNFIMNGYFKDMEFMPGNPQIIYAATYSTNGATAIYRSSDNGETWNTTKSLLGAARTALAVTTANPRKVFAISARLNNSCFHSFYVSSDSGLTWNNVANSSNSPNILGREDGTGNDAEDGQGWYDLCLAISPLDENLVFIGGINIWKSQNGGINWELATHEDSVYNKPDIHVDEHDIIFRENSNDMYVSNDGGIYRTTDIGVSWEYLTDGMNITQFYRMGCDASNPERIVGGCQDNGTKLFMNGEWAQVGGADGMEAICDYSNPDIIYISSQSGFLQRTNLAKAEQSFIFFPLIKGEMGAWTTPFVMNPLNSDILYVGAYNVWKSWNRGDSWTKISNFHDSQVMISLAVSPADSNIIYAATAYTLYKTSDAGNNWNIHGYFSEPITYIAVSYSEPDVIWVSCGGFDEREKVWAYNGENWINLTGNLPNVPVNAIVCQKGKPEKLYIGTDIGVFTSSDTTANWEIYGKGLPNLIISELEIQYTAKKLRAATYGMGIWEVDIDITDNIEEKSVLQKLVEVVPNPASELLITNYELLIPSKVKIEIYNSIGNKITTLVDEYKEAGNHNAEFKTGRLPQGMYYCVIHLNGEISMQKFIILK